MIKLPTDFKPALEIEDFVVQSDALALVILATGEATVTVNLRP